jgi:hypothetical protein
MEKTVERVLSFLTWVIAAACIAVMSASIAHDKFGLSPQGIRTAAVLGAGVIAVLVAIEFFGTKLRKAK